MALSRDVVIRLLGDADSAVKAQKAAADAAGVSAAAYRRAEREQDKQAKAAEAASVRQRAAMDKVGRGAMLMGGAMLAGLGMATKAAMDWESAWTGVLKTVNGSPKQLAAVEQGLRNLARTLPSTHEEIAAVAEAAGQLGIQTPNIVSFTKTMIDLGQSTNLSAEDAATALARFMNIMGTSQDQVSNLGASLVALGNSGASTESEIADMATRLASAGHQIGLTEGDVLGIANALSSVGIEAEAGGTAFSKVMLTMRAAVDEGGKALDGFADTAGMTAEQFKTQFQQDAGGAIAAFVKGLANMEAQGKSTQPILAELGFSNVRVGNALRSSAAAADMFTSSMKMGNDAFEQNTALIREASKRYDTTASKVAIARNNFHDAAIEIGQKLLPALASIAEDGAAVAQWFSSLPGPIKSALAALGSVAGVAGVVGGAFLLLTPRVLGTVTALKTLQTTAPRTARALSGIGKAAGVATAIVAVTSAANALTKELGPQTATVEDTTSALLGMGASMDKVNKMFRIRGGDLFESDINGIADAASRLTDPSFGDRVDDFFGGMTHLWSQGDDQRQHLIDQLGQVGQSLAVMVQSGNGDRAKEIFNQLATEWKKGGGTVKELRDLMPEYGKAVQGAANDQKQAAETAAAQKAATQELASNLDVAYGSIDNYTKALGLSDDEATDFINAAHDMGASLADFADPLDTYKTMLQDKQQAEQDAAQATADSTENSKDSWKDYVKDVHVSFDEYLAQLEKQVKDQQNWEVNMLSLAGRVSQGTLDELAKMGPQGASLVADMVNASDAELARFDDVTAARSKDATDAWGEQLAEAQPVLAQIAATAGQDVVDQLAAKLVAGTTTVAQIASQYGISLAGGINPLLSALGSTPVMVGRGGGRLPGQVVMNAAGNLYERHDAEIAPGGAWRMWAEPETGGEAYIPLAASKRPRSRDIWRETGRRLGVQFQEFAGGGFSEGIASVPKPTSTRPFGPPISTAGDATMQREYLVVTDWMKQNGFEHGTGLVAALAWARTQVGKPYIWGGVGPAGYDCSGFQSALVNVARGRSPYSRVGSTANFPWPGFAAGYGAYTIGSSPDAGGGIGHMAGTLLGVNVESSDGGVHVGAGARGADSGLFSTRAHLVGYQTGTPFVPATDIYKLHLGEAVLNREQAAAYRTGLAAGAALPVGAGSSRGEVNVVAKLDGARISGSVAFDPSGVLKFVDARIDAHDAATARDVRSARR